MALDCTPAGLQQGSKCIECALTHKQLLAAMVYLLCTQNNMNCSPASLMQGAKCIMCLTEKQLIAALVYIQCTGEGSAGGTFGGNGSPVGVVVPSGAFAIYIQSDSVPNPGALWEWYGGAWHLV